MTDRLVKMVLWSQSVNEGEKMTHECNVQFCLFECCQGFYWECGRVILSNVNL